MPKIIAIHSFRGGTGKSNTAANLAALLAARGWRIGVIDTDIQSPGIHVLFGMDEDSMPYALNDYLWGDCTIAEAAYDVTATLNIPPGGQIFLIPSSVRASKITRIMRESYDVGLINDAIRQFTLELDLDVLLIDTHPGLSEETLLSIAISDVLVVLMRPDRQDYQGTSVTVEVARKLEVPRLMLVVNKAPPAFDLDALKARVAQVYGCEVGAVLPHAAELMTLASAGIFALHYPDHPVAAALRRLAAALVE